MGLLQGDERNSYHESYDMVVESNPSSMADADLLAQATSEW